MNTDPQVYDLAVVFVDDTIRPAAATVTPEQRAAFCQRVADAMQTAIENECRDIEAEIWPPCPVCHGDGTIGSSRCESCNGTGRRADIPTR